MAATAAAAPGRHGGPRGTFRHGGHGTAGGLSAANDGAANDGAASDGAASDGAADDGAAADGCSAGGGAADGVWIRRASAAGCPPRGVVDGGALYWANDARRVHCPPVRLLAGVRRAVLLPLRPTCAPPQPSSDQRVAPPLARVHCSPTNRTNCRPEAHARLVTWFAESLAQGRSTSRPMASGGRGTGRSCPLVAGAIADLLAAERDRSSTTASAHRLPTTLCHRISAACRSGRWMVAHVWVGVLCHSTQVQVTAGCRMRSGQRDSRARPQRFAFLKEPTAASRLVMRLSCHVSKSTDARQGMYSSLYTGACSCAARSLWSTKVSE